MVVGNEPRGGAQRLKHGFPHVPVGRGINACPKHGLFIAVERDDQSVVPEPFVEDDLERGGFPLFVLLAVNKDFLNSPGETGLCAALRACGKAGFRGDGDVIRR